MSETKFTEGNWWVEVNNGLIESATVFYPHGFFTSDNVIEVDETRLNGESWIAMRRRTEKDRVKNAKESVANMHLIAAASDMYKAADATIKLLISLGMQHTDEYRLLVKSTAKARGEVK